MSVQSAALAQCCVLPITADQEVSSWLQVFFSELREIFIVGYFVLAPIIIII